MSPALRRKKRKLVIARGSMRALFPNAPPLERLSSEELLSGRMRAAIAVAIALGLHWSLAVALLRQPRDLPPPPPRATHREIAAAIVRAPPPPPPPAPARPPAHLAARAPPPATPPAPPPPAQAGRAIAVEGPADLTSFDLIVGQGKSYAGGTSAANGTNLTAVHEVAKVGAPPRKSFASNFSRSPFPLRRDWACAWPDEAQDSELRDARVTVRVQVSSAGEAKQVEIIAAPPGQFADALSAAARRCAEGEHYRPALDPAGAPIDGATLLFTVRFVR